MSVAVGIMQLAGLASIGAGAIHAGVAGLHAEQTYARPPVRRRRRRPDRCRPARPRARAAGSLPSLPLLVNLGAVAAWGASRLWGIGWIDGLETAEDPQFTDTACAALGAIAVVAAVVALVRGRTAVSTRAPRRAGRSPSAS